jgi:hypothetical protein
MPAAFAARTVLVMDGELARIAAAQGGFVYRWQALDCGVTENEVAARLRHQDWVKLRRGAYAPAALVASLSPEGHHALLTRAVVGNLSGRVVVTGYSALAIRRVPLWGVDLTEVHVHRDGGRSSRRAAGVVHHTGPMESREIDDVDGLLLASAERALLDACRCEPFEPGVVMADGVRRLTRFDLGRAHEILDRQRDWAGSITASQVLRFSNPLAASVGESRGRVLMARIGMPAPALQRPIVDDLGGLIGVCDFYIESHATVAEFDGKVKYGRALYERNGNGDDVDLSEVLWREKRREDLIRDQGHEVVRFVWADLDGHDAQVRARFVRAFERAARRRTAI